MLSARSAFFPTAALALLLLALFSACTAGRKTVAPPPDTKGLSDRQFRKEVVNYAVQYIGSTYKPGGKSPKTGFDCSGFTSFVLDKFKVRVSPASSAQATEGKPVSLAALQPGDLVIFGKSKKNIQHVALVVERGRDGIVVVHSTTSRGVIKENITSSTYWKPLILSARDVISGR
ncbi:MAG: C40 family peptidase [Saprospiraceae bacterium]|nr:C40 family peptidase [Saprospiraceae bacterium]